MAEGWIKLYRKIQDTEVLQENKPYSRFEAWIYLLLHANHADSKVLFDGNLIDVTRGSLVTSVRKLCEKWKWSNTKVCKFLKVLENEKMIVQKSDAKKTVLTIVNYEFYQDQKDEKTTQKRHRNDTETTLKRRNKNEKNEKNEKNINNNPPYIPPLDVGHDSGEQRKRAKTLSQQEMFSLFWQAYPKKRSKGQAEKAWEKIKPDEQLHNRILESLERAKTSVDWKKEGGKYIPYPATWLNAKGWEDEYQEYDENVPKGWHGLKKWAKKEGVVF